MEPRLYPVYIRGKTGYIDSRGNLVIPYRGPRCGHEFSEGLAHFEVPTWFGFGEGKFGYLDVTGRDVIRPKFAFAREFSEGFADVEVARKHTFVASNGHAFSQTFEGTRPFHEGLAAVWINQKWGFIDTKGELVIKPQFDMPGTDGFSEGLASVIVGRTAEARKYGYINRVGEVVVAARFDQGWEFKDGLASVRVGDKFGYIRSSGEVAIESRFDFAWPHFEGLARIRIGDRYGFIDRQGALVIAPQYYNAGQFSNGLAWVRVKEEGKSVGFVDAAGNMVIAPKYNSAESFRDGIVRVELESVVRSRRTRGNIQLYSESIFVYINQAGEVIYDPPSDFTGG